MKGSKMVDAILYDSLSSKFLNAGDETLDGELESYGFEATARNRNSLRKALERRFGQLGDRMQPDFDPGVACLFP